MASLIQWHEFEQTPGDSEREGSLACCSPQGCKESDMTQRLNNNNKTLGNVAYQYYFHYYSFNIKFILYYFMTISYNIVTSYTIIISVFMLYDIHTFKMINYNYYYCQTIIDIVKCGGHSEEAGGMSPSLWHPIPGQLSNLTNINSAPTTCQGLFWEGRIQQST